MRTLVWHWGRRGAGPIFAAKLAAALNAALSLAAGAEILASPNAPPCDWREPTYETRLGYIAQRLASPFLRARTAAHLRRLAPDFALCAMPALLDARMITALNALGIGYGVIVHDAEAHPGDALSFRVLDQARLLRGAKHLFCLSTHVEQTLRGQGFGAKGQTLTKLWHPPLDLAADVPAARPTARPRLLYFGRLLPYKGLDLLANALEFLGDNRPFELRICGDGPNSPALERLAAMPGVAVERRWFVEDELPGLLAWADALVLPYREASQSGVAAMALAAGRRVLATSVGGLPEQLEGQPGAILCAPNAPAIAQGLLELTQRLAQPAAPAAAPPGWDEMAETIVSVIAPGCRGRNCPQTKAVIAAELPYLPPEAAFAALAETPGLAFLDSAASGDPRACVSYLCLTPRATLRLEAAPYATLRRWMAAYPAPKRPEGWPFPFAGGAVGWIGYDLAREDAGVESRFAPLPGLPGGWFGLYDTLLGFDPAARRLVYLGPAEDLPGIAAKLRSVPEPAPVPKLDWAPEMSPEAHRAAHERLRDYIVAGDIYQANLTMRFTAPRPVGLSLPALHMALRRLSPAPFAACIQHEGFGLACASPERFLRLTAEGEVETRPIKGTAARSDDPDEDATAAAALHASPKERAENLMITDLLRNDLGQVCRTGSVAVPELWAVESYAQAHHLVSAVTGRLKPGLDAFDLLAATLPGGSITGAPKRRAMQIIDELEAGPRGAYCGALAWIGFDGAMDSAIIIRTLTATSQTLYAQAGGGITWDSVAGAEYDEAMVKISPLLALGQ